MRITFIKKRLKKIINFFLLSKHKINPIGTENKSIIYLNNHIIDLDRDWKFKNKKVKIISYSGDLINVEDNKYPVIESWTVQNKITFVVNDFFRESQLRNINKQKNKKVINIREKIYVLPYYTSQFGHFIGDVLGSLIFYLQRFNNSKRKILTYSPSSRWDSFFLNNFANNVNIISPKEFLENNFIFYNSIVLPRMSSFQNIQLARNYFTSLPLTKLVNKKVFLTTERADRISNIEELKKKLSENGFSIINPKNLNIVDLFSCIRNSDILICEKGSVMNNLLFSRDKYFYLLSSKREKNLEKMYFAGAGLYKSYLMNLIREIYCDSDPIYQDKKPYGIRIKVNVERLLDLVEK